MGTWEPQASVSETGTGVLQVYWATHADEHSWWWSVECRLCKYTQNAPAKGRDAACSAAEVDLTAHARKAHPG